MPEVAVQVRSERHCQGRNFQYFCNFWWKLLFYRNIIESGLTVLSTFIEVITTWNWKHVLSLVMLIKLLCELAKEHFLWVIIVVSCIFSKCVTLLDSQCEGPVNTLRLFVRIYVGLFVRFPGVFSRTARKIF